jgi:hypothetical protein
MQANPDKFQFLAVGRKTYDKYPSIYVQNFDLTCESSSYRFLEEPLGVNALILFSILITF